MLAAPTAVADGPKDTLFPDEDADAVDAETVLSADNDAEEFMREKSLI